MPDSFSPLFAGVPPGGSSSRSLRVQVVNSGGLTPLPPLKQASDPQAAHSPQAACDSGKPVKVSLEKNGDVVTGIRIDCGCGQVITLSCVY